eukprot:540834-Prymnesium_polylepis.1
MAGGSIDRSIALYREATGAAPLPPKGIFGFMHSTDRYPDQANLTEGAQGFRERDLAIDTIVQDWYFWPSNNENVRPWHSNARHCATADALLPAWTRLGLPSLAAARQSRLRHGAVHLSVEYDEDVARAQYELDGDVLAVHLAWQCAPLRACESECAAGQHV